jgi:hypothetical protein
MREISENRGTVSVGLVLDTVILVKLITHLNHMKDVLNYVRLGQLRDVSPHQCLRVPSVIFYQKWILNYFVECDVRESRHVQKL